MRRTLVPLAIVLSLISGLALAETRRVLLFPAVAIDGDPRSDANAAVIHRFYGAVNTALATGETESVAALLDARLIDHAPRPGVAADRSGFLHSLRSLHASDPTLRLTVLEVVAQGDRVATRLSAEGGVEATFLGLPVTLDRRWGAVDLFRIEGGRIVEHWGDATGLALFEPLFSVAVPVEKLTRKTVTLERWTFAPGAGERWSAGFGFLVLHLETGSLTVELDGVSTAGWWSTREGTGEPAGDETVAPGQIVTLNQGDTLVVPEGGRFSVRNDGSVPGIALAVVTSTHAPINQGVDAGAKEESTGGEHVVLAGRLSANLPHGLAIVAVGRAALGPGAALPTHRVGVAELVVVEAGMLALTANGDAGVTTGPADGTRNTNAETLSSGGGVFVASGTDVTYRAVGDTPLSVLMVTIGPAADGSMTEPTS